MIDIPKTGSRSFRETLAPHHVTPDGIVDIIGEPFLDADYYQHGTLIQAKQQFEKNKWPISEYYKFVVVRNPWSRYLSFWKYLKEYSMKYERRDPSIEWGEAELYQGEESLKAFNSGGDTKVLRNIIHNHPPQHTFYNDENDQIAVNQLARFENIQQEFDTFCEQVGIESQTLVHGNKSKYNVAADDIYDKYLIDLVAEKEKTTIDLMSYTYNE